MPAVAAPVQNEAPAAPERSRAEAFLARKRAALPAASAPRKPEPSIGLGEFMLMLFFAAFFDLVSLVPWLNLVTVFLGNVTFGAWFWFKGLSFKKLRLAFALESIIELVPFLSILPGFLGLVITAYVVQRAGRLIGQLPGGQLAARALEGRRTI
ncbi:hypothetical protein HYZ80_03980 [Candidatus Parcubacteria bacterium]|nr:hypothetical protein [Candidatus Parcubacteria bacterium]